jgi:uroporphyrinogen decarboxylase
VTTSRQRIQQTLNFVQPERVPVDFGGHRSSGIMAMAYSRLRDYLGLPSRPLRILDMILQLAVIDEDVLDRFGVDTIDLSTAFHTEPDRWKPWVLPDGTECFIPDYINLAREGDTWLLLAADGIPLGLQKPGMIYFEQLDYPMRRDPAGTVDRLEEMLAHDLWSAIGAPPGPLPMTEGSQAYLAEHARRLRERTSRYIITGVRGPLFEGGQHLFGMDNFYVMLASEPNLAHRFLDNLTEAYLRRLEFTLTAVGPYIDMVVVFDDFGMQTGLQISPRMYRTFFKPRQKRLWSRIKELAPEVRIQLHSCGSMAELLPDMAEVGLDAWNPVQISAHNMAPERLKPEFGRTVAFWGGGCDTQHMLKDGTPSEIRAHVWHNLDVFAPRGGYVFTQVHNIMADVPPQNIVAMFDAVTDWSRTHG